MFNAKGAFTQQFTQIDGGYLYYPSRKSGGKFLSNTEYEGLEADWLRVAGALGQLKAFGIMLMAALMWTLVHLWLTLPSWADWLLIAVGIAAFLGRALWASLAPRRLVQGRPDFAPPRPISEARRDARAAVGWPLVLVALLGSGAILFVLLSSPQRTIAWGAWATGSGLFFIAYLWIAVEKVRDRRR